MSEQDDLLEAYRILGVTPGKDWTEIINRYKTCVMMWHPDRAPADPKWKISATEELKKLNWAKDILERHFKKGRHNQLGPCMCNAVVSSTTGSAITSASSPTPREDIKDERQGENADWHGIEENAKKFWQLVLEILKGGNTANNETIRWRLAIGMSVIFVSLCILACAGVTVKAWCQDVVSLFSRNNSTAISKPEPQPPINQPPANPDNAEERRQADEAINKKNIAVQNLNQEIDNFRQQLKMVNDRIIDTQIRINKATNDIARNESVANAEQLSAHADFVNNETDKKKHPLEFAQWQAFTSNAEVGRKELSVLQTQKADTLLDKQKLDKKLEDAQTELTNLR